MSLENMEKFEACCSKKEDSILLDGASSDFVLNRGAGRSGTSMVSGGGEKTDWSFA